MGLIEYLPILVPMSVSALVGIVSLFLYFETRKTGYVLIGVGFLTNIIPGLVELALGGPYLALRLYERGLSVTEIGQFLFVINVSGTLLVIVFALLVLIGLILFMRDFKTKQ